MKTKVFILLLFFSSFLYAQQTKGLEKELDIPSTEIVINGTLLTPQQSTEKLVILIPGSGPTDRNGNNSQMKNNSLKFLAEGLAKKGIASYRYDKSAIALAKQKNFKESSVLFNNFIDDAKNVVQYFKNEHQFSKIFIAGHSQGSLVGMIASNKDVSGFISLAGAGRSIDQILNEQLLKQAPILQKDIEDILSSLKSGKQKDSINPLLKGLFRKSVQPFLISWMQYDPQIEIEKLNIPVLIINGTKDIQVPVTDAELLHKSSTGSELKIIENMNHLFKEIKGDINENISSYNKPELPITTDLVEEISNFVKKQQ